MHTGIAAFEDVFEPNRSKNRFCGNWILSTTVELPAPRCGATCVAKRAPRGANRAAVLRVLGERPGVSAAELAAATGIKKPVVYALLSRLIEDTEATKASLPSGSLGYSLAPAGDRAAKDDASEQAPVPAT